MSLFEGTAEFYRRYRSGVPVDVAQVLDRAAPAAEPGRPRRLLDLGTGTGFVVEALRDRFDDIIGVDAEDGLLAVARDNVTAAPGQTITFELSRAEEFTPPTDWTADLVTICRTFHWLDRTLVLSRLDAQVSADGVVAVFGDNSIWAANAPWKTEVQAVLAEFLGDHRRAGAGTYTRPPRPYTDDLDASPFSAWDRVVVPVRRERSLDSVIGYLHSTSFAAPHLFGDRLAEFDQALADRLPVLVGEDSKFIDDNAFDILLARRP